MNLSDSDKQWLEQAGMTVDEYDKCAYLASVKDPAVGVQLKDADIVAAIPKGILARAGQCQVVVQTDSYADAYMGSVVMLMSLDKNMAVNVQIVSSGKGASPKDALLDAARTMEANRDNLHGWASSMANA